jgi:hypothetical protein
VTEFIRRFTAEVLDIAGLSQRGSSLIEMFTENKNLYQNLHKEQESEFLSIAGSFMFLAYVTEMAVLHVHSPRLYVHTVGVTSCLQ